MKVQVTHVSEGWKPNDAGPNFKLIYTIHLDGYSEPQKTQDETLAVLGNHDAEQYVAKSGKPYWRTIGSGQIVLHQGSSAPQSTDNRYKADPVKQESIEWQACLKAAVETVHAWNQLASLQDKDWSVPTLPDYKKQIVEAVVTFTQTIEKKPDTITPAYEATETMVDQGDYAQVSLEELPPVEAYEGMEEVDLNSIPF